MTTIMIVHCCVYVSIRRKNVAKDEQFTGNDAAVKRTGKLYDSIMSLKSF